MVDELVESWWNVIMNLPKAAPFPKQTTVESWRPLIWPQNPSLNFPRSDIPAAPDLTVANAVNCLKFYIASRLELKK